MKSIFEEEEVKETYENERNTNKYSKLRARCNPNSQRKISHTLSLKPSSVTGKNISKSKLSEKFNF